MRGIVAVAGVALLSACATNPNQSMLITDDTALITRLANETQTRDELIDATMTAAARFTREHGYRYFMVVDTADASQFVTKHIPGRPVTYQNPAVKAFGTTNLSNVYLANAQYTGTSGLTIHDQASVMERRIAGTLSPGRSVAAIGGMETAADAIQSVMDSKYPGKVVIFPQIHNLPLTSLKELKDRIPEVADRLGEDNMWTNEAEEALIEKFWQDPA